MLLTAEIPKTPPAQRQFANSPALKPNPSTNSGVSYEQFETAAKRVLVSSEIPAAANAFRARAAAGDDTGNQFAIAAFARARSRFVSKPRPLDYYSLCRTGWNELSSVVVDRIRFSDLEKTMLG